MKLAFVAAAAVAANAAIAHAQSTHTLAQDAAAFGERPAVSAPALSPDGSSVLYITPGPGATSYAVISNLQTGKSTVVTTAGGHDQLQWCDYAALDRIVCRVTGASMVGDDIVGSERLIAIDTDGKNARMLGQPESFYDAYIRQVDGSILDWRGSKDGSVLMVRAYIPEAGKIGTRLVRSKEGLGVDEVDTRDSHVNTIEPPNEIASGYITDGRGNVRIMRQDESQSDGRLSGRVKYYYRTKSSHDWKLLVDYDYEENQLQPLAVDADSDSLYALKKKGGREALYTIKLDGSMAETLVAENPRVDIDDVVRIGKGLRVIGYTYVGDKRHVVYSTPSSKRCRRRCRARCRTCQSSISSTRHPTAASF